MCPTAFRRCRLLPVLLALLLVACGDGTPALQPLAPDARVLAFGDSLTYGTGAGNGESYPRVLAGMLGREVINAGVPGEESSAGRDRLAQELEAHRPALLILCHGGNDILRNRDLERTRENLAAMVEMARDRDIEVVLVGVPARSLFSSSAGFYAEVAEEHGVPLEGEVVRSILEAGDLRSDPVHPNAAGYRVMAAAIHDVLAAAGAVPAQ